MTANVIGREADQASVDQFLDGMAAGSAGLIVSGEAGIGKTTLWSAALESATGRRYRVLVARPAESEARLSYSGLGDLLDAVADEVLPSLPEPQRRALEVALLRAVDDGNPPDQRGVSVAVLGALRLLGATAPVVVAIDDVQWLDNPSARVLHFALRRLGPAPVGVALSLRTGPGLVEPLELAAGVDGARLWRIDVGPLSVAALHQVVRSQLGTGLAHPTMVRIHRASGGNPFYALELARALRGRDAELVPGQPLPVPEDLSALVSARLAALPDEAREAVQVVAAMAQPTVAMVSAVLGERARGGITDALDAGVIDGNGDRLRLAHPLVGSVAYYQPGIERRRDLHQRIAAVVVDPEERARHLALAASGPDAAVAQALDEAAWAAAGRGAPDAAAEMCELARRLTPAHDEDQARRRSVRMARHHFAAGDWPLARRQLENVVAATSAGPVRARALKLLGEVRYFDDFDEAIRTLEQARAEAGEDRHLRASVELDLGAAIITLAGDTAKAGGHARRALDDAERFEDPDLLSAALAVAGFVDFVTGRPGAEDTMVRAVALENPDRPHVLLNRPSFLAARVWMWTDRQGEASAVFERLYQLAVDRGEESALPQLGFFASYLACRMGQIDRASRYAQASLAASVHVGGDVSRAAGLTALAMVATHVGDAATARQQFGEAAGLYQRSGWGIPSMRTAWMHGFLELSAGDPAAAHRALAAASGVVIASGMAEPALAPWVPDDIEALILLGDLEPAETLLVWLEQGGHRLNRAAALAAAARCRALMLAEQGQLDEAVGALATALELHDRMPLPVERGRTLLVKGQVERRRKQKHASKLALEEAVAIFGSVGARMWEERARHELSRVGLRPPAPTDLTATEVMVAELAATGATTKQVAEKLFMSPRTVEGVLSRVYQKLGVGSRAELANAMAARRSVPPNGYATDK